MGRMLIYRFKPLTTFLQIVPGLHPQAALWLHLQLRNRKKQTEKRNWNSSNILGQTFLRKTLRMKREGCRFRRMMMHELYKGEAAHVMLFDFTETDCLAHTNTQIWFDSSKFLFSFVWFLVCYNRQLVWSLWCRPKPNDSLVHKKWSAFISV